MRKLQSSAMLVSTYLVRQALIAELDVSHRSAI